MPNRSSIKDINKLAKTIVDQATSSEKPLPEDLTPEQVAARILGRKGGLKGGKARAANLSPRKRKQIAIKAANARWANKPKAPTS